MYFAKRGEMRTAIIAASTRTVFHRRA